MLLSKHLAPNNHMTVDYSGCQLAQRLVWVAPAYYKKEGVTLSPETCKHSRQCDGGLIGTFFNRAGIWNIGSLSAKRGEVWEEIR